MKFLLYLSLFFIQIKVNATEFQFYRNDIDYSSQKLKKTIEALYKELPSKDLDSCINKLKLNLHTAYDYYVGAGLLYSIEPKASFEFHEIAYKSNEINLDFLREYAIELHRQKKYDEACKLYLIYDSIQPYNPQIQIWLSDCFINLNLPKIALEYFTKANHRSNHTSIDFAVHTIYGKTNQFRIRNDLRKRILSGDTIAISELIYLDLNWELDWWNKIIQKDFLVEDYNFISQLSFNQRNILEAYKEFRELEESAVERKGEILDTLKFKRILLNHNLLLKSKPIPENGKIASTVLQECFNLKLIEPNKFYKKRGNELLELANKKKDADLLNIYAYLQILVQDTVSANIDLLGWKIFHDARFAVSYLALKNNISSDNTELNQAIKDFPESIPLLYKKAFIIKKENQNVLPLLVKIIQLEFRTLDSDSSRYSYQLKYYFGLLSTEL